MHNKRHSHLTVKPHYIISANLISIASHHTPLNTPAHRHFKLYLIFVDRYVYRIMKGIIQNNFQVIEDSFLEAL